MAAATAMTHEDLLERLGALANASLPLWDVPDGARARLINLSENATYLVEAENGFRSVLRVHRENYHSRNAISCELAWSRALDQEGGVVTPPFLRGRNGDPIQTMRIEGLSNERHMVMFAFLEGEEPDPDQDLVEPFEQLGEIAARTHIHSCGWKRPERFERLIWDEQAVFGAQPTWGDWRAGPNVDRETRLLLERLERELDRRLQSFGKAPDRYGLIHADMRLANLLIDKGETRLIDFDDCGLGWFLYDFATGISFMEDHPQVPALKEAWVKGYRRVRPLSREEEAEIDTFVMLRRMALLAWIGSHAEVDTAKELAPNFAEGTAGLAEEYLRGLR